MRFTCSVLRNRISSPGRSLCVAADSFHRGQNVGAKLVDSRKRLVREESPVLVERTDGVAVVTLNRPAARNTLTTEVMEVLRDTAVNIAKMPDVIAVILCANGPFSAGVDLSDLMNPPARGATRDQHELAECSSHRGPDWPGQS